MASAQTRRVIAAAQDVSRLSMAIRARRRLQEEAIRLRRTIVAAQARLSEVDEEEALLSEAIDAAYANLRAAGDSIEPEAPR